MHLPYRFLRLHLVLALIVALSACTTQYANQNPIGLLFPDVSGSSLDKQPYELPRDFAGQKVLLLIGYKQNAQFDIDRWMIGLDMTGTRIPMVEVPTIQGLFPRLFQSRIDNGMRAGIPEELWQGVITVYQDGDRVQEFTGNENPNNARVVLLNGTGRVIFFHDRGFSVPALNDLRTAIQRPQSGYNRRNDSASPHETL